MLLMALMPHLCLSNNVDATSSHAALTLSPSALMPHSIVLNSVEFSGDFLLRQSCLRQHQVGIS
jgi:hypothetical protein